MLDGVRGPLYPAIRSVTFSPDSRRLVYVAEKPGKKFCVVLDGKEQSLFDEIVSNEIDEPDRGRWRFEEALAALDAALPRLLSALDG